MGFFRFVFSKVFLINVVLALGFFFLVGYFTLENLKTFTKHKEYITVPDYKGVNSDDLPKLSERYKLRYEVVDSIYDKTQVKGSIHAQNPKAHTQVKENRIIYITIVAKGDKMIKLPDLGNSLSFARNMLNSLDIQTEIEEIYDAQCENDCLLKILHEGRELQPGDELKEGSQVTLLVGNRNGKEVTLLPNLVGMKPDKAKEVLKAFGLRGKAIFKAELMTAADSANAVVVTQRPAYKSKRKARKNSRIDYFIGKPE